MICRFYVSGDAHQIEVEMSCVREWLVEQSNCCYYWWVGIKEEIIVIGLGKSNRTLELDIAGCGTPYPEWVTITVFFSIMGNLQFSNT